MAVTFKDIDLLSQKSAVAGTEKLEVSDTEYITPAQIIKPVKDVTDYLLENMSLDGLTRYKKQINSSGSWASYYSSDPDSCVLLPITPGEKYQITGSGSSAGYFAILAESSPTSGSASFATGYSSRLSMSENNNFYEFVAPSDAASIYLLLVNHSGATYDFVVYHLKALASYEQTSNKVTSMSSSSTDEQYPSAKCVYDAIQSAGGGVSDVTLGGSSVVSSGVAVLPAYPTTLPASDVYSWAKASTKPTYTASEVGALPASTSIPANTSDLNNDSGFKKITISSSEPTSSDGSNGDIWIVI